MADNAQKLPMARALNIFAQRRIEDAMQLLGQQLPARVIGVSGSIVTVAFEITSPFTLPSVTMPIAGSQYVRCPTQVGDKGFVVAADAYLGGVSGLGGGTADLTLPANLSALVFVPVGNKTWPAPIDPNALELWGPAGVILRNGDQTCVVKLTADGVEITLPSGKALAVIGNRQDRGRPGRRRSGQLADPPARRRHDRRGYDRAPDRGNVVKGRQLRRPTAQ
jgi:hypothetical protein